jgi:DNA modification methylase
MAALTNGKKFDMVFTSPPYLQVIKYAKYNWVRLWFLGEEPSLVDEQLMAEIRRLYELAG